MPAAIYYLLIGSISGGGIIYSYMKDNYAHGFNEGHKQTKEYYKKEV